MNIWRIGMVKTVQESITAAVNDGIIKNADSAKCALALKYAAALDEAYDLYNSDGGDFDMLLKTLNIAGPNLNKALDSLGCAPYSRKDMQAQATETDRLDELIEQRGKDDQALVARIMAEIDGEDA
ncbi:hypothetical protein [Rothia sp. (in: high G+C Gram-positive bacteria)]|uniref:terminase small subunit n=1 Tax=Rothia sp. (in: high G+C Gram-positive bacteria) TaxID=1885016 RepID=UPI001CB0939B|nr:hypothetical protein [Rothia sp. (in: high G+C Gram-positive bacteria)]MBF1655686.1 hypothetical protein [Rothia sp. (in: high G+C Gram-positive bacteria)]